MGEVRAVVCEPEAAHGRVLLLPGFTGSKEDYFAVLGPMREQGWAVAAADLPGMYESAGSPDPDDYRLELLVADVQGMVRAWGGAERVHLVGHSAGGFLARHAALADPGALASLTLYDSGSGPLLPQTRQNVELLLAALDHRTPGEVHQLKSDMDRAAGRPVPSPAVFEFLSRRWHATSPGHLRGMAAVLMTAPDLVEELADLSQAGQLRIMTLYGEHDAGTWEQDSFARIAQRTRSAAAVIPGAEHSPAVENPAAMVAALVDFWRPGP
jgi:pimeloyl-ACP methyl ester carboxylesterase